MHVIKQIGVLSLGKVMGMSMALFSLVVFVLYAVILVFMGLLGFAGGAMSGESGGLLAGGMSLGMMVGMALGLIIIGPLIYGFIGFIGGLIYGLILNIVLRMAGGLELEIEVR